MSSTIESLIVDRDAIADDLRAIKAKLKKEIQNTKMYKDLYEYCSKSNNFQAKESEKYCINTVLKSFENKQSNQ